MKKGFMKTQEQDKNHKFKQITEVSLVQSVFALPLTLSYNLGLKCDSLENSPWVTPNWNEPNVRNRNWIKRYIRWSVFHIKVSFDLLYQLHEAKQARHYEKGKTLAKRQLTLKLLMFKDSQLEIHLNKTQFSYCFFWLTWTFLFLSIQPPATCLAAPFKRLPCICCLGIKKWNFTVP